MAKFKVLMTDTIYSDTQVEQDALQSIDAQFILASGTSEDELIEAGKECDGVMNIFALLTAKVIDNWPKCKVIARSGIGLDTVDIEAVNKNRIMLANVPDATVDAVAEHAIALIFTVARKIVSFDKSVKSGTWDFSVGKAIHILEGKNLCFMGFGNIAQNIAKRLSSFGFKFFAYDPFASDEVFKRLNVTRVESLNLLSEIADFLTLHLPLNKSTQGIINKDILKNMKSDSVIINTSRGPLINEDDLIYALKNKLIGGCGLDVLSIEPPKSDNELLSMDQVVLTPHAAFYNEESIINLRKRTMMEIVYALTEGKPHSFVNKKTFEYIFLKAGDWND